MPKQAEQLPFPEEGQIVDEATRQAELAKTRAHLAQRPKSGAPNRLEVLEAIGAPKAEVLNAEVQRIHGTQQKQ